VDVIKNIMLSKRNGQSIVETALVLPIIVLILTGIIDFGMLLNNYSIIINASREGARFAAVGCEDEEIKERIKNMTASLKQSNLTPDIYPSQSMRKKGEEVTVTVGYNYSFITPVVSAVLPDPLYIEGKSVMRVE
jgi:Flp pilus assembly protein TadG